MVSGQPIVFLDTETTGLHPNRRVWEVAAIRRDDQGDHERRFFVKNVDLSEADPYALKVGGFYDRHPQYCPGDVLGDVPGPLERQLLERYQAAQEVERITRGATIVGSVPSFDTEVLGKMLRSLNLTPAWHYHLVDIKALAAGWLLARGVDPGPLPWSSDHLAELCGVEPASDEDRHTALGDTRWVRRWWDTITTARDEARALHPAHKPATVTPIDVRRAVEGGAR